MQKQATKATNQATGGKKKPKVNVNLTETLGFLEHHMEELHPSAKPNETADMSAIGEHPEPLDFPHQEVLVLLHHLHIYLHHTHKSYMTMM